MHPQLDFVDQLIRMLGLPALLGVLVWATRTWDRTQRQLRETVKNSADATAAIAEVKQSLSTIQNNHLSHLQIGIEQVAKSNDRAVDILQDINGGIKVLVDRDHTRN